MGYIMIEFLIAILAVSLLVFAVMSAQTPKGGKGKRHNSGRVGNVDREFVARKWSTIQIMASGNGSQLRDAVSEADKLLDYAMKQSGFSGQTMGERLKYNGKRFSNLNAIWNAHKLRNALAHEADFDLVPSQAREAVNDLGQGLRDLGAL